MPRLIVKFPGGPKSVPVGGEAVTIGRTSDNTIPIDDVGVSRRHVQILFVGKGYELVDMGSRNGTKVNGQKAARSMLKAGDVIQVGGVDMVFQEDGGSGADSGGGLEVEELDLGGAQASAPSPLSASATMAMSAGGLPPGECVLRFIDGERKGTEMPLKGVRTTVGRRASNTVSFQEAAVSGVHCEITREANGYVLRDLGSTNGTLVDGEPVVETLLRHNSRIRIGGQRILFVDPTVADIESSLAGADDALEWGLMRGEIDVTAGRARGGRGVLVAALVVLVVTGGGAWWVIRGMPAAIEVAAVKDNRISDFSFEEGVVRWFSPEEGGAMARIAGTPEAPRGASGVHSIEVVPQGEGFPRVEFSAAAQGGPDASVAPDAAYEISAKVGSGSGAVVVVWVSTSRQGLVREVSSPVVIGPVVEGGGSWPVTRAVVIAPAQATAARIQLAAFGGRPAVFDDVVFRRAEEPGVPALDSGDLHVRVDAGGFLEAVRGGEVLLTQAGLAPSADTPVENLLGATLAGPPALAGAVLSASGTAFGGGAFDLRAEVVAGGAALTCVPKGGAGAFTFTCPSGLARNAVTLVLARTALVIPEDETFKQEGVRKIIVGSSDGPDPFVLSADKDSPGFSLSSRRTPRGLRVQLAPPAGSAASVLLSVDLSRENEAAQALLGKARADEALGKKGAAAEEFRQAAIGFHYLPAVRKEGEENKDRLVKDGTERFNAAKELVKSGIGFGAAPDLTRALAILDPLARDFRDHAIGEDADKKIAEANAALEKVRREAVAQRSERLYRRANDYKENGLPALELPLLEEIVRIAPAENAYRIRAATEIPEVQAKVRQERESLYGTRK
jgi:pSer/pThr/pTyr-binding forkhead associated (FHA) protein